MTDRNHERREASDVPGYGHPTQNTAYILSFEPRHGWVVIIEQDHQEDEDRREACLMLQQMESMAMFGEL
jgi:hypothetical protein